MQTLINAVILQGFAGNRKFTLSINMTKNCSYNNEDLLHNNHLNYNFLAFIWRIG